MDFIKSNVTLDTKGLACPMPIVKTKKMMNELEGGHILEVLATDKGSKADLKAWAQSAGHHYLGTIEEGEVLKHYIRKLADENAIERSFSNVISNEELDQKLQINPNLVVLDVREETEYVFDHIPNAISLPLGEIEERLDELNKNDEIFVVCRTGSRSDLAAQKLLANGFHKVVNVVPGMSQWTGITRSIKK